MRIQGIFAALNTADLAAAERFYAQLFAREPDDRPIKGLIRWRDVTGANIQIFESPSNAGAGRLTIVVPEIEDARQRLATFGVALSGERESDSGKIAQIRDPDGNHITLAEPLDKL